MSNVCVCSVTTNIHLDVLSKPSVAQLAQLSWPKQNALMRKRILSTPICIWVELETRTYSYLPKHSVQKRDRPSQRDRERERGREIGELVLCFLRWHTKICAKGLLLTNERAGKKCGRIALFFSLSCSQAVEREEWGGRGEDNRHKPAGTQTCTCAPQTHARGKDMPCVLAAHLFCPIHSHLQTTATADCKGWWASDYYMHSHKRCFVSFSCWSCLSLDVSCQLPSACLLPAAFSGLIPVQPFVRCQQDMHKWPVFSSRGSTTLLAFYLYLLLIVAVSRLLLLL